MPAYCIPLVPVEDDQISLRLLLTGPIPPLSLGTTIQASPHEKAEVLCTAFVRQFSAPTKTNSPLITPITPALSVAKPVTDAPATAWFMSQSKSQQLEGAVVAHACLASPESKLIYLWKLVNSQRSPYLSSSIPKSVNNIRVHVNIASAKLGPYSLPVLPLFTFLLSYPHLVFCGAPYSYPPTSWC